MNLLLDLNQDIYGIIYSYISYFTFTTMRMTSVQLYYSYPREIRKSLLNYHKSANTIIHLHRPKISCNRAKQAFISRVLKDLRFRNRFIRLHDSPQPHLCLKHPIPDYYINLYGRLPNITDFFDKDFIYKLDNYLSTFDLEAVIELLYHTVIDDGIMTKINISPSLKPQNSLIYFDNENTNTENTNIIDNLQNFNLDNAMYEIAEEIWL